MKQTAAVLFFVAVSVSTSGALDLKELAPCRPAAEKLCDRSGGKHWDNLLRCGAKLASNSSRIGKGCRAVLKRYGQL